MSRRRIALRDQIQRRTTMPRGRKPTGDRPLTGAERQACYCAAHAGEPGVTNPRAKYLARAERRSRLQRWRGAVAELFAVQAECAAWLDALPEALRDALPVKRCKRLSISTSNRNGGRLQIGIPGRLRRNPQRRWPGPSRGALKFLRYLSPTSSFAKVGWATNATALSISLAMGQAILGIGHALQHWPFPRWHSTRPRLGRTCLVRRSFSAGRIGYVPSS